MTAYRSVFRAAGVTLAVSIAAAAFAQSGARLPADIDAKSLARLPYVTRQDVNERLANIFARNGQPTDPITGPLAFASYNVPVATALLDLHDGAVGKSSSLNPHVRELAIMVACRETNYNLEWNGHEAAALKAGVDPKVLEVVRTGGSLKGLDDADAAVIQFGRELIGRRKMSSETFAKVAKLYGNKGAMDVVAVMGTYAVSGFFAIAVDEHPPAGKPSLPSLSK
ncbi:MAG TPA: carboxymuconolactone decarboxylase family protein [Gammaproteobacteria bacterium]|nr:carboxymuconolactone decarboxylase family protein [Gammaproteobacteria bacterium]